MSNIIHKLMVYFLVHFDGGEAFSLNLRKYYAGKYNITIGYGSYGWLGNSIPPGTQVGNYCSIATGLKIFQANHPYNYFTMHPIFYNPEFGFVNTDVLERQKLIIGNDVWIGASVIILPTVKSIGNGAVIGAGSVVTKDVEPYNIVAGNPARLIKMRFSDSVIKKLEESKWWNLSKDELIMQKTKLEKTISLNRDANYCG